MFEILGQRQRPLGACQKLVLSALLTLERSCGEGVFTTAAIFEQCRVTAPRLPGERKRPLDTRTRVVKGLVERGLVDQPRAGCAAAAFAAATGLARTQQRRSRDALLTCQKRLLASESIVGNFSRRLNQCPCSGTWFVESHKFKNLKYRLFQLDLW